jgi:hypothetical protein
MSTIGGVDAGRAGRKAKIVIVRSWRIVYTVRVDYKSLIHAVERDGWLSRRNSAIREFPLDDFGILADEVESNAFAFCTRGWVILTGLLQHQGRAAVLEPAPGQLSIGLPFLRDLESKTVAVEPPCLDDIGNE